MKSIGRFIVSLVSLVISALAAQILWLNNWWLTAILISSFCLHEFGHVMALRTKAHVASQVVFIPFLGAATIPEKDLDTLDWYQRAFVALAGPLTNIVLAILAGIALLAGGPRNYMLAAISLNISLVAWNLLPILGILDGGRFTHALFSSMKEDVNKLLASIVSALALILGLVLAAAGDFSFFYIFARLRAMKNDPQEAYTPEAITWKEAQPLSMLYCLVLFSSIVAMVIMPFWLDFVK